MATEVKHGPSPKFNAQIKGDGYSLTLRGYYTTTPGLTAGGVTSVHYESGQAAKRRNELLGMRSIFVEWWLDEWVAHGGSFDEGVFQIKQYPFSRR